MLFIDNLNGKVTAKKPVWLMRQAGRYLVEYQEIRKKHEDFMGFCQAVDDVVEVTLQPIRRFGFDAAIIFSDILVVPHFLGQKVTFKKDYGPMLERMEHRKLDNSINNSGVEKVYEAIEVTKSKLSNTPLIGFIGGPWTVGSYMLSEGKTNDFNALFAKIKNDNLWWESFQKLTHHLCEHAINQIKAGCDALQIFESWASFVPAEHQNEWLFEPAKQIISKIREFFPKIPIIYYARGLAQNAINDLQHLKVAFGVDETVDLNSLNNVDGITLQGNVDNNKLLDGSFESELLKVLDFSKNRAHIVNLGHGVLQHTPVKNVERFMEIVRG